MAKRALFAFLVIPAVASTLIASPPRGGNAEAAGAGIYKQFDLFSDAIEKVRANYVVKPDDSKLAEDAINGVLAELAPPNPAAFAFSGEQKARGSLVALSSLRQATVAGADIYEQFRLLRDVFKQIRVSYAIKPDESKLVEYAIKGAVTGLDPHSTYLSPKEVEEETEVVRGAFGGLGVNVKMESDGAKVIEPLDNMPAERSGVLAGDTITAIDGKSLKGLSMGAAGEKMRGPVGSSVTLTLARSGVVKPITVKVVRDVIRFEPVQYSIKGDVGWIKVKSFESRYTADHVRWAVEDIKKALGSKVSGYVLDLRNNPGGLLDQAIAVADAFLDGGAIVITKGRNISDVHRADAKLGDIAEGKQLVVLINGGSASASEIVAGALQDHNRATLLGTRSYGKGSVQTLIPLVNKGAIRLTTARYYTPSGRSIQAVGIEPDYDLKPDIPQKVMLELASLPLESESQLSGHLKNDGVQERTGSSTYVPKQKEMDDQLNAAIALIHAQLPETDQNALSVAPGSSRS
jgi:carboxyl-terminal processing protease